MVDDALLHFNCKFSTKLLVIKFSCEAESKIARQGTYDPHWFFIKTIAVASSMFEDGNTGFSDNSVEDTSTADDALFRPTKSGSLEGCDCGVSSICRRVWCFKVHLRQCPDGHLFNIWPSRKQFRHNFNFFASWYLIAGDRLPNVEHRPIYCSLESQHVKIAFEIVELTCT